MTDLSVVPPWFWVAAVVWYAVVGLWVAGLAADDEIAPMLRSAYHSRAVVSGCMLAVVWALSPVLFTALVGFGLGGLWAVGRGEEPKEPKETE